MPFLSSFKAVLPIAYIIFVIYGCADKQKLPSAASTASIAALKPDKEKNNLLAGSEFYGKTENQITLSEKEKKIWDYLNLNLSHNQNDSFCKKNSSFIIAARHHAFELFEKNSIDPEFAIDYLKFDLQKAGNYDYQIEPGVFDLKKDGKNKLLNFAAADQKKWTHCGIGIYKNKMVWIGTNRIVSLNPLSKNPKPEQNFKISGTIKNSRQNSLTAFLELPDGKIINPKIYMHYDNFIIWLPVTSKGIYRFELLANRGRGPETAVLLPLYVKTEHEKYPTVVPRNKKSDYDHPAQFLINLINKVRKSRHLTPLKKDNVLMNIALNHCNDMARTKSFGHYSSNTGSLKNRLEQNNIHTGKFAENVAKSTSLFRIHHNLMQSPSHKQKILDPGFTSVGTGVKKLGRYLLVTQIFAARN
jgi:hypothetical protein